MSKTIIGSAMLKVNLIESISKAGNPYKAVEIEFPGTPVKKMAFLNYSEEFIIKPLFEENKK